MSLTRMWLQAGLVELTAVVASNPKTAHNALAALESDLGINLSAKALEKLGNVGSGGLILVATPDDVLIECARKLAGDTDLAAFQQMFFCSGSIESEAVAEAVNYRVPVIGVHPMMSFATEPITKTEFEGVICAYEGNQASPDLVVDLFTAIGGRAVPIDAQAKIRYHLGTVFACNYINALHTIAEGHLAAAGLGKENIQVGLSNLMRQTLRNIDSSGAIGALTGPVTRGDVNLIKRQLEILRTDEQQLRVYKDLANILVDGLEHEGRAKRQILQLRALLN